MGLARNVMAHVFYRGAVIIGAHHHANPGWTLNLTYVGGGGFNMIQCERKCHTHISSTSSQLHDIVRFLYRAHVHVLVYVNVTILWAAAGERSFWWRRWLDQIQSCWNTTNISRIIGSHKRTRDGTSTVTWTCTSMVHDLFTNIAHPAAAYEVVYQNFSRWPGFDCSCRTLLQVPNCELVLVRMWEGKGIMLFVSFVAGVFPESFKRSPLVFFAWHVFEKVLVYGYQVPVPVCSMLAVDTLCCLLFIFIDFDKEIWRNLWWKISTVSWSHDRTKTDAAHKYFVSKKFLDFGTFDFSSTRIQFKPPKNSIPFQR